MEFKKKGTIKCDAIMVERQMKALGIHEGKDEREVRRIPLAHKFSRGSTGRDYEGAVLCENLSYGLRCLQEHVCALSRKILYASNEKGKRRKATDIFAS